MKADTFLDAVGMIDERYLDISRRSEIKRSPGRRLIAAAAAAALILCPLPALTAFGSDTAYDILYHITPAAAQAFKPVQKSCTDKGIVMTVISAERKGSEASICLSMHDTAGTFPEGEWDLYDSYRINVPRDMNGHCSFSEYDSGTHTAYFIVHLETMDGSPMPDSKVTFSVHEMLLGKFTTSGAVTDIDLSAVPFSPETVQRTDISGSSYYINTPDPKDYRFLTAAEKPLSTPAPGVSVMNTGYIDGALHILTRYDDVSHTDNHGFISLLDKNGAVVGDTEGITFDYWDASHINRYQEMIIPVSYEMLKDCSLEGEFTTAQDYISGDWEVTFPLK